MTPVEQIRKRPAMYVGDVSDGSGVLELVSEVVANALDQHLAGRCTRAAITLARDGTVTVDDDGPGMRARGGDGVPPLDELLARRFDRPTVDGHRPHVHLGYGGAGLFVVNALSERFELRTVRDGMEASIAYEGGVLATPLAVRRTRRASGTWIRFRPDPRVFTHPRVPRVALARQLEDLSFVAPGFTVSLTLEGDDVAARGLAGRVALGACCQPGEVATHRAAYETKDGPVDVEVALAWRDERPARPTSIESFVNLRRTPGDGRHVDGLHDGLRAFLGGTKARRTERLVAAVSVILADVHYGNPMRDRLDSPHARAPVAAATQAALAAWAHAHSAAARELRARVAGAS